MPCALRSFLITALLAVTAGTLAAQATALSPGPTLPSDTLAAAQPADSFPADSINGASSSQASPDAILPDAAPVTPGDSAALRELKAWIRNHPEMASPPPDRAVLAKV